MPYEKRLHVETGKVYVIWVTKYSLKFLFSMPTASSIAMPKGTVAIGKTYKRYDVIYKDENISTMFLPFREFPRHKN